MVTTTYISNRLDAESWTGNSTITNHLEIIKFFINLTDYTCVEV